MSPVPPAAPAAPPRAAPRVSHRLAAVALSLLLGLQPVTTDVYLPALPMLTRALGASMSAAQLTMSALILAFGLAQMVWGPVADRVGRRPVLLWGLLMYTAASIGGALAGSIEALVVWRVVQGAGMAAAVVCARAIVRDLYEPVEGAQVMALALSGLGLIALCGPLAGGTAALIFGWRGALAVVASMGASRWPLWPGACPRRCATRTRRPRSSSPLLGAWWHIGRHPVFLAWGAAGGLHLRRPVHLAGGLVFCLHGRARPVTHGLWPGHGAGFAFLPGRHLCLPALDLAPWHGRRGKPGGWFTLAGGLAMAGAGGAGVHAVWAVLLPQCLFTFGHGIHQPCGQAGVVGPFPKAAGAASALAGLLLALTAFGIGRWLGVSMDGTRAPHGLRPGLLGLATSTVAWTLVQRHTR
jgi:DHA1 family bicyclomycin/chloramphenicol resistance-like MFS transporter